MHRPETSGAVVEIGLIGTLVMLGTGEALPPAWRALPILALLAGVLARQIGPRPVPLRLLAPFAAFVAVSVASALLSSFPERSLRQVTAIPATALVFIAAQMLARDERSLVRLGWSSLAVIGMIGVDGLVQWWRGTSLLGEVPMLGTRVSASLPNPNDLGYLPLLLPLAIFAMRQGRGWLASSAIVALMFPAIFTLIASQSRNAWLGAALALGLMAWLWAPSRRPIAIACVATIALALLMLARDPGWLRERLASFASLGHEGRWGIFRVAFAMFIESPMLGRGPGTFIDHYVPWLDRVTMPPGYAPELVQVPWAHNIELELLAERGALGFAAFLWLLVAAVRSSWPGLRAPRRWPPTSTVAAIGLAVFLVMGQSDLTFIKDWIVVVLWLYLGIAAQAGGDPAASSMHRPLRPLSAASTTTPNAPAMSSGSSRSSRYIAATP